MSTRRAILTAFAAIPVTGSTAIDEPLAAQPGATQASLGVGVWTDFGLVTLPLETRQIFTSGYQALGIGGACYVRDSNQTSRVSRSWRRRSANGTWFRLAADGQRLSVTMFGAGLDGPNDVEAFRDAAAFADGRRVHVPKGTYNLDAWALDSDTHFEGDGDESHLRFTAKIENHFIVLNKIQRASLRWLRIDGNPARLLGGATKGAAISISNDDGTFEPRINDILIENCRIEGNGFTGIGGYNAHGVSILNNRIYGARDTAIAAVEGCSNWIISGNRTDGFSFGISLSNDGSQKTDIVGRVRNHIVTNNICQASKKDSFGMEFDGVDNIIVSNNVVILDGGLYGIRLITSGKTMSQTNGGLVTANIVTVLRNASSAGIEIQGALNTPNLTISGNTVTSSVLTDKVHGLSIVGGASVTITGHKSINLRTGLYVEPSGKACTIQVRKLESVGCKFGVFAPSNAPARCRLVLTDASLADSAEASMVIGKGFDLDVRNTFLPKPYVLGASTVQGLQEAGSVKLAMGAARVVFDPPKPNANYAIVLSSDSEEPVHWTGKSPSGFSIASRSKIAATVDWTIQSIEG
jgi:hypothetical protein